MKLFTEQVSAEAFTVSDYPFTIEDAGEVKITVYQRCE
jgi:hypothetical protein